jgi:copper oxidase (laccase) domain-containing protein
LDLSNIADDELEEEYATDGLFINRPGVALMLNPADCIAMALYSKNDPVLGVIHAGRHGVDGGIHEASVNHMADNHGIAKSDIRAYFSPSIRQESYYYPAISAEQLADPKWKKFIDKRGGNYHIDLVARVVKDLVELDIDPRNIQMTPIDVGADARYFSHSRSKRTGESVGRNGFAAMIRGD